MKDLTPRQRDIVRASRSLFAEKGFEGVSMRDIAAQAGVQVSTLYSHFSGKEALYLAMLSDLVTEKRVQLIDPIPPDLPPLRQLHLFCIHLAGLFERHPDYARLVQWVLLDRDAGRGQVIMAEIWRDEFEWVLSRWRECVGEEQALTLTLQLFGLLTFEFSGQHLLDHIREAAGYRRDARAVAERTWRALACQVEKKA